MVLVYHKILQDDMVKGSFDFMGKNPIKVSYHLANFNSHRHSGCKDIMISLVT